MRIFFSATFYKKLTLISAIIINNGKIQIWQAAVLSQLQINITIILLSFEVGMKML
jgi:hypothetical protein